MDDVIGKKCEYLVDNKIAIDRVTATIKKTWKSEDKTLCSFEENSHVINFAICKILEEVEISKAVEETILENKDENDEKSV